MVYLSLAYAPYYAVSATPNGERMALVEVDTQKLEQGRIHPDEDYIEQCLRVATKALKQFRLENASLQKRQRFVRRHLDRWKGLWPGCLEHFGNICYKGQVEPSAITRIVVYSAAENPELTFLSMEPTITIQNYKFCGNQYRTLTKFFIGDEINPEDLAMRVPAQMTGEPQYIELLARIKHMIANRKVETIFENPEALRLARESEAAEKSAYGLV